MRYMVLYTDGSCRPNPGISGFGVHGYIGKEGSFKQIDSKWVITDKGYKPKKDKNKYTTLEPEYIIERYGRNGDTTTNNQAELEAIEHALMMAKERLTKDDKLHIVTDSDYSKNYLENILKNKKMNYTANSDYLKRIKDLVNDIEFAITIERVNGHAGILGNEEADTLSNIGRNIKSDLKVFYRELVVNPKDYWFYEPDINEFLKKNKKLLIMLKNRTIFDNKNLHCVTNYKRKKIDEIGKKDPEIKYSIISSKKDVEEINLLLDIIKDGTDMLKPFAIDLSEVLNKKVARKIKLYGKDYISRKRVIFDIIETNDSTPITLGVEIYPESLSWYTVEHFKNLYKMLNDYRNNKDNIHSIEIKDDIFKNIKEEKFVIKTNDFKIPLVFRINIPEPSLFTNLKKKLKNVKLLYRENNDVIYDTMVLIETEDEWMIETNYFGKIRFKNKK